MPKIQFFVVVISTTIVLLSRLAWAQTEVRVIGYHFPPFVTDKAQGLTQGLAELLNSVQSDYTFKFYLTSPNRRYREFRQGTGDLIFFENPEWGWKQSGISYGMTGQMFIGGEVFITNAKPGRDQTYFDDVSSKRIVAYNGYHYGFAQMNSDPTWLTQNFDIMLTNNHQTNIRVLLADRADISIITQSFLNQHLHKNPQMRKTLLVSTKKDQIYRLGALVRENGPITAQQLEQLLDQLKKTGQLKAYFKNHGLESHLTY